VSPPHACHRDEAISQHRTSSTLTGSPGVQGEQRRGLSEIASSQTQLINGDCVGSSQWRPACCSVVASSRGSRVMVWAAAPAPRNDVEVDAYFIGGVAIAFCRPAAAPPGSLAPLGMTRQKNDPVAPLLSLLLCAKLFQSRHRLSNRPVPEHNALAPQLPMRPVPPVMSIDSMYLVCCKHNNGRSRSFSAEPKCNDLHLRHL
jgi:hypothetical protein